MDASRIELSPAASSAAAWRYIWRATSTSVRHLREPERDRLVFDDGLAEGLPLARKIAGRLERGPGRAHRLGGHRDAPPPIGVRG